ncbi:MAG: ATP-binding protein [Burkholderiales bacterium]|nr:ATP-binding protein [Burkholderiales bacterium]
MGRRKSAGDTLMARDLAPIVKLWIFRILVTLGGQREFLKDHHFSNDSLAKKLGLEAWVDAEEKPYQFQNVKTDLRKLHQSFEREFAHISIPEPAQSNIERLAALAKLSNTERDILGFAIMLHSERELDDVADMLGFLNNGKTIYALSVILNLPLQLVRESMGAKSALRQSGLVSLDRRGQTQLRNKLDLISESLVENIDSEGIEPISFIKDIVSESSAPTLTLRNYPHVESLLEVMRHYLRHALATKKKGVNIFIHGSPGTGKSQLAKAIAQDLQCQLFEISSEDHDGDPVSGEHRLRAFSAAQRFFGQREAMILFDEVEDVFEETHDRVGAKNKAQSHKAWINRSLEENLVPAFWISNSHRIDPAMIRRFDIVLELPVPPRKQREDLLRSCCESLIEEVALKSIAKSEVLAPAVIARTASVVKAIQNDLGDKASAQAFELLINNTLVAQGHPKIKLNDGHDFSDRYDPAFICADVDLEAVARGIGKSKTGRLCLFGPPGTGKTAFGRWLSEQLDMPLLVKRGSDLISMWVGGTEKNIARAFDEAKEDSAILLVDEVDSFLQDRRGASQSWEVTAVNEMLTQMETYSGVFIASTNLIYGLDQAALRRFDLKVKFDFMCAIQVEKMYLSYCCGLDLPLPSSDLLARVSKLNMLTPGDFATIARQHKFRPIETCELFYQALKGECALKEGGRPRKIGF